MRRGGSCSKKLKSATCIERAVGVSARSSAPSEVPMNNARVEVNRGREVEVEATYEKPTAAERKAVEDFFDWLLAEALRSNGEVDEAA